MNIPKQYEIGCQLLLITNRKSHTGFRLVPTSVTLNGIIALILHFSLNSIALLAIYITVVEDRSRVFVKYWLSVPVFHFWPELTHPAAQSLCDS